MANTADANTKVAQVELHALPSAKRMAGTRIVDPSVDLVEAGIITFIPAF